MTDEELDKARAEEAWRIANEQRLNYGVVAARLAREGWMPVDPLENEINKIMDQSFSSCWGNYETALAALKRGIEIGKENI